MRPSLQLLERRQLFAAYFKQEPHGVLRAFGTDGDDHFVITVTNEPVAVNDNPAANHNDYWFNVALDDSGAFNEIRFLRNSKKSLRIYLGRGNDTVEIRGSDSATADKFDVRMFVDAGKGNDTISTGSGDDQLYGGKGADELRAGLGSDTIDGGSGNDRIRTGGNNVVGGGDGEGDVAYGKDGNDRIYTADRGQTEVTGNAGDDTLFSAAGADWFDGSSGIDTIDYSGRREKLLVDLSPPIPIRGGVPQSLKANGNLLDDGRIADGETVDDVRFTEPPHTPGRSHPESPTLVKEYAVPDDEGHFGTGSLEMDQPSAVERVVGGFGDDTIKGTFGADTLRGGAGNDMIFACIGQDDVFGEDGDDRIFVVDTRDAMPTLVAENGRANATDLIDGGPGRDFARVDARDFPAFQSSIEKLEWLRPLTS